MLDPGYKRLEIEWKHFTGSDAIFEQCGNTGEALRTAIEEFPGRFVIGQKINRNRVQRLFRRLYGKKG